MIQSSVPGYIGSSNISCHNVYCFKLNRLYFLLGRWPDQWGCPLQNHSGTYTDKRFCHLQYVASKSLMAISLAARQKGKNSMEDHTWKIFQDWKNVAYITSPHILWAKKPSLIAILNYRRGWEMSLVVCSWRKGEQGSGEHLEVSATGALSLSFIP